MAVFLFAVVTGVPFLDHEPFTDELNHVLAARALVENGTLEIVPGAVPYGRARAFTYLVAGMFRLFGESLAAARLPALVSGSLLATLLFLWVRSEVGRVGGWVAALLLTLSLPFLQLTLWARFYTLQALLIFAASLAIYRLLSPPRVGVRRGILLLACASTALLAARPFQDTALIAAGGLALWAALVGMGPLFRALPSPRARGWTVAGLVALAAAIGVALHENGFIHLLWFVSRSAEPWAEANRANVWFYHDSLLREYPVLWALFPLGALGAVAARFRPALLCLCVFGTSFLALSLLAQKSERYLFYAMPFFFAIWGIAVARWTPWLRDRLPRLLPGAVGRRARTLVPAGVGSLLVLSILYPAVARPAVLYGLRELRTGDATWIGWGRHHQNPGWRAAGAALQPAIRQARVLLVSDDLAALFAFGRADFLLRRSHILGEGLLPEFTVFPITRVPVVSSVEALARVMACNETGLVFLESKHLHRDWTGIPAMAAYLDTHANRLRVPEEWELTVYRWDRPVPLPAPADCGALPRSSFQ